MKIFFYVILSLIGILLFMALINSFAFSPSPKIKGDTKIVQDSTTNILVTEWHCDDRFDKIVIKGNAVNKTGKKIVDPQVTITVLNNDSTFQHIKPYTMVEGSYENNDTFYFSAKSIYVKDYVKPAMLFFEFSK